jgi:hypothetical protein
MLEGPYVALRGNTISVRGGRMNARWSLDRWWKQHSLKRCAYSGAVHDVVANKSLWGGLSIHIAVWSCCVCSAPHNNQGVQMCCTTTHTSCCAVPALSSVAVFFVTQTAPMVADDKPEEHIARQHNLMLGPITTRCIGCPVVGATRSSPPQPITISE